MKKKTSKIIFCLISSLIFIIGNGQKKNAKKILFSDGTFVYAHSINNTDHYNETILLKAASNGNTDKVKILLKNGAKVDIQNKAGETALLNAATYGYDSIVDLLLQYHANLKLQNYEGNTALMNAVSSSFNTLKSIKLLVLAGADFQQKNKYGDTPLMLANGVERKKYFIDLGANVNDVSGEHFNPNGSSSDGLTVLQYALEDTASLKLLISKGADVNAESGLFGNTALMIAAKHGYFNAVKILIQNKAEINKKSNVWTALAYAGTINSIDKIAIANYLLEHGAIIDKTDSTSAWMLVRWAGSIEEVDEIIKILIDKGADINAHINGTTPLHNAIYQGNHSTVKLLLENGADPNIKDQWNYTPILRASIRGYGDTTVARMLLDYKANINYTTPSGENALFTCIGSAENINMVRFLVNAGINVNQQNKAGKTPLMLSAQYENVKTFEFLLSIGANQRLKDKKGNTIVEQIKLNRYLSGSLKKRFYSILEKYKKSKSSIF